MFAQFKSFYCHFEEKRLIINFHWLEFCLKSFCELHMSFNGFMLMRMRQPHFESKFQFVRQNLFLYSFAYMFQISFQSSKGQKSYLKFLGVRSELSYTIVVKVMHIFSSTCTFLCPKLSKGGEHIGFGWSVHLSDKKISKARILKFYALICQKGDLYCFLV